MFVTDENVVGDALTVVRNVSGGVTSTLLDVAGVQDAGGDVPLAPAENVSVPNVDEVETPGHVQVNVSATFATAGALGGLTVHVGVMVFDPCYGFVGCLEGGHAAQVKIAFVNIAD